MQSNRDGISIHSHLTELIHTLLTEKDVNALQNLENISLGVKAKRFVAPQAGERVRSPRGPLMGRSACIHEAWNLTNSSRRAFCAQNPAPPPSTIDDAWRKATNALFTVSAQRGHRSCMQ
jgi:hypothetical protein